jgi:hypothetical protein
VLNKDRSRNHCVDVDPSFVLPCIIESNGAVDRGEERVISAHSDVFTGMKARSALTHENRSGGNYFATERLDA